MLPHTGAAHGATEYQWESLQVIATSLGATAPLRRIVRSVARLCGCRPPPHPPVCRAICTLLLPSAQWKAASGGGLSHVPLGGASRSEQDPPRVRRRHDCRRPPAFQRSEREEVYAAAGTQPVRRRLRGAIHLYVRVLSPPRHVRRHRRCDRAGRSDQPPNSAIEPALPDLARLPTCKQHSLNESKPGVLRSAPHNSLLAPH